MRCNRFLLRGRAWAFAILILFAISHGLTVALAADVTISSGPRSFRKYYPPPNEQQLRVELIASGTNIPNNDGKMLASLKDAKIKQYSVKGELQLTAETPACIYDVKSETAWSDGPLQFHTEDGKMFLEGTGFFLSQSNALLIVSNNVHSVLELPTDTNGVTAKTEIFAGSGVFHSDTNNGSAIYRRNVRVKNERLNLTCELLTVDLPRGASGQTNRVIVAETNVVLDSTYQSGEPIHATSQRAVYRQDVNGADTNQTVELTQSPRVEFTNGWMTANKIFLNDTTRKMQARENVHFHYVSTSTNSSPVMARDVFCDLFDFDRDTRQADFTGNVRENDSRANLAAEFATMILPASGSGKTSQPDQLLVRTNVVIDFQNTPSEPKVHATGQQAIYNYHVAGLTTNETVTLIGNPTVQTSKYDGWMTADTIMVDKAQGLVSGTGNCHSVMKLQTNTLDTEIFSERFDYSTAASLATYHDNVRVFDPNLNATGKTGTIKIGKFATNHYPERVQLDDAVTLDFIGKAFTNSDFTNLNAIVPRLQQPTAKDGIAQFLSGQLSTNTQTLLADYGGGTNAVTNALVRAALATDFNRIIRTGPVYDPTRLDGVYLTLDTSARMRAQPLGVDLIELNRQILLDAFGNAITRNPDGEIIHATGDHAVFEQKISADSTNRTATLTGHPQVIRPNSTATAQDYMTADLITGKFRLVGRPYLKTHLVGVDMKKVLGNSKKETK